MLARHKPPGCLLLFPVVGHLSPAGAIGGLILDLYEQRRKFHVPHWSRHLDNELCWTEFWQLVFFLRLLPGIKLIGARFPVPRKNASVTLPPGNRAKTAPAYSYWFRPPAAPSGRKSEGIFGLFIGLPIAGRGVDAGGHRSVQHAPAAFREWISRHQSLQSGRNLISRFSAF